MKKILLFYILVSGCHIVVGRPLHFENTDGIDQTYLDTYSQVNIIDESYNFYIPKKIKENSKIPLFVYIHASDEFKINREWKSFCKKNNVAMVAPQNVGNQQSNYRRIGVAILGLQKIISTYPIDKDRLYIMGYSGGGRVAAMSCFYHPEIFVGCLGICGINFHKKVEFKKIESPDDYGYFNFSGPRFQKVKDSIKFAIITGNKDFRYDYLKEIAESGFKKNGFKIKLFDIPAFEHQLCSGKELGMVYKYFIDEFQQKD